MLGITVWFASIPNQALVHLLDSREIEKNEKAAAKAVTKSDDKGKDEEGHSKTQHNRKYARWEKTPKAMNVWMSRLSLSLNTLTSHHRLIRNLFPQETDMNLA